MRVTYDIGGAARADVANVPLEAFLSRGVQAGLVAQDGLFRTVSALALTLAASSDPGLALEKAEREEGDAEASSEAAIAGTSAVGRMSPRRATAHLNARRGAANGVASLGASLKIPVAEIPSLEALGAVSTDAFTEAVDSLNEAVTLQGTLRAQAIAGVNNTINEVIADQSAANLVLVEQIADQGETLSQARIAGDAALSARATSLEAARGRLIFSPSGDHFVEAVPDITGQYQIRSTRVSDGAVFRLSPGADNYDPVFDADGGVLWRSNFFGEWTTVRVPTPETVLPAQLQRLDPTPDIGAWGDSMTAGVYGNTPYTTFLAALTGRTVRNYGVIGQVWREILARQGGTVSQVTVAGNSIPAGAGVPVAVTAYTIDLLSNISQGLSLNGFLAGVYGALSVPPNSTTYAFTRADAGVVTASPPGTPFIPLDAEQRRGDVQILWGGRNNGGLDDVNIRNGIKADIAAAITYMSPVYKRYLVVGIVPHTIGAEDAGQPGRATLDTYHAELVAIYGTRFVDIGAYITDSGSTGALAIMGIAPTAQDQAAFALGRPPASLMADTVHLNALGNDAVARLLFARLKSLGWVLA